MPRFDTPINTNDQSLERVLANPLPVLLVISQAVSPVLQSTLNDIARSQAGNLLVVKLNPVENPAAARRFNANGGTTLVSWKNGAEQVHLDDPTPEQIRGAAEHLLGRGPVPRNVQQETARPTQQTTSSNGHSAGHPITVDERNFDQEVLRSDTPVLVDFWAAWCGPCRMIAPTLEKLAGEYAGKVRIAKLNVDQNQRLAAQYGAHSIPLLVMFKGGKPVQQLLGAHPEPNIRRLIEQAVR
ncbi:MAG: thioredoxin [Anaerolineae bacterium]|nr:thioredoxin [Anaerolineae bacterium]